MPLVTIEDATKKIRSGHMVILVNDECQKTPGYLVMAAEKVTAEAVNFMTRYGRGLICLPMSGEKSDSLDLPPMGNNTSRFEKQFTVSIEAKSGVTTGISASDRATTILAAVKNNAQPDDLVRPGHVFPLRVKKGGVLVRAGYAEGAVDLARLSGLQPVGVICEIMDEDGETAKMPILENFSQEHDIAICSIESLIEYRIRTESLVNRIFETVIPTAKTGVFRAKVYENDVNDMLYVAMIKGEINPEEPVLVRIHSECLAGDIFGSLLCDCGFHLFTAMDMMDKDGGGVLLYMTEERGGVGLLKKLKTHALRERGFNMAKANGKPGLKAKARSCGIAAQILANLGVRKIKLLINNPNEMVWLERHGLNVTEQVPMGFEQDIKSLSMSVMKQKES